MQITNPKDFTTYRTHTPPTPGAMDNDPLPAPGYAATHKKSGTSFRISEQDAQRIQAANTAKEA